MNAKQPAEQPTMAITDNELRVLQAYRSCSPEAQPLFLNFFRAIVRRSGVRKAALAFLLANGDPDADVKALEAVERLGAKS
ncbi:hypothetical protein AruPA_02690 [Acidiphilium sp. PA]|uniref:hypothetical protein n=1 Tax=Acidiphilium sp. PA TaxID=2871705 RepID=UPI002243F8DF|nr:hypothetical protein [Acidiphilium sp. PA]MCW8305931.1 hypothetical protein [Acidiphilium sp. PA]